MSNVAVSVWFAGPLGSALSNAYETRVVVMTGGCLAGLGLICASQATSLVHLYLTMGVISGERLSVPSLFLAGSKETSDPLLFFIFFLLQGWAGGWCSPPCWQLLWPTSPGGGPLRWVFLYPVSDSPLLLLTLSSSSWWISTPGGGQFSSWGASVLTWCLVVP